MKVYNTLSRKKETLKPLKDKKINLFVCGPTVYDFSHLGHARTYIAFDMIVKYLRQSGFEVFYLQNITDIDDKIINKARMNNESPKDLADRFEKEYVQDMESLAINGVTKYAKATDHIQEIISQVKRLIEKSFAYEIKDGIYYDISKFKDYGKLSGRTSLQAEDSVSRIDESINKRNKGDFCLWKYGKEGEPSWPFDSQNSLRVKAGRPACNALPARMTRVSVSGGRSNAGRPGWHIEDTAITEKYFGSNYDIHGGARDLIFPHHEAEIAQMEAISGKPPLVKYWLHTGFITINNEKMSKSLGNFVTIKDFLEKYNDGKRILRLFVLKNHYRSPIDYNEKLIPELKSELNRIDEFTLKIKDVLQKPNNGKSSKKISAAAEKEINKAMDDDFNTPLAFAAFFKLINEGNTLIAENKLSRSEAKGIFDLLQKLNDIFDFMFPEIEVEIPENILKLAKEREKYRQKKEWKKADEIRKKIEEQGYQIKDTKDGAKIKK